MEFSCYYDPEGGRELLISGSTHCWGPFKLQWTHRTWSAGLLRYYPDYNEEDHDQGHLEVGKVHFVDGPAAGQAKNSNGSFHLFLPLPNGERYDFFQASPRAGLLPKSLPHYIVVYDNR